MISVVDRCEMHAPPHAVWQFFEDMEAHYRAWHPDHLRCRDLEGNAFI